MRYLFFIFALLSTQLSFGATAQVNSVSNSQGVNTNATTAGSLTVPLGALSTVVTIGGGQTSASLPNYYWLSQQSGSGYQVPVSYTYTGNLTSGSYCIASPSSTTGLYVGEGVVDTTTTGHIPYGTFIAGLPGTCSSGQIQLTAPAGGSGTGDSLNFGKTFFITDIWCSASATNIDAIIGSATASFTTGASSATGAISLLNSSAGVAATSPFICGSGINIFAHYSFPGLFFQTGSWAYWNGAGVTSYYVIVSGILQ